MEQEKLTEILNSYNWIKVKFLREADQKDPNLDWKDEYSTLLNHHKKETEFLINKCRELAQFLLDKDNISYCECISRTGIKGVEHGPWTCKSCEKPINKTEK